jgi:hypothetical protein
VPNNSWDKEAGAVLDRGKYALVHERPTDGSWQKRRDVQRGRDVGDGRQAFKTREAG